MPKQDPSGEPLTDTPTFQSAASSTTDAGYESIVVVPIPFEHGRDCSTEVSKIIGRRDPLAAGACLISAADDVEAASVWFNAKSGSTKTFVVYRKEIERFFWWLIIFRRKTFATTSDEDIEAYRSFVLDPPASWCAKAATRRDSPFWKPFSGRLSPRSSEQAIIIIRACFQFLKDVNYLSANPWASQCRKSSAPRNQVRNARGHAIPVQTVISMLHVLEARADEASLINETERLTAERNLFIVRILVNTGLRRHELACVKMSDNHQESTSANDVEKSFVVIRGEGKRSRHVALNEAVMASIQRYRNAHRATLHFLNNETRLLLPFRGGDLKSKVCDDQLIYRSVKQAIQAALLRLDPDLAIGLIGATPHDLRHTFATILASNGGALKLIQEQLGHESIETTATMYADRGPSAAYDLVSKIKL